MTGITGRHVESLHVLWSQIPLQSAPIFPPAPLFKTDAQVAKTDLAQVRTTHPFNIKIWNIRDPPRDAAEEEVKKWRRLYQYEIVSARSRFWGGIKSRREGGCGVR